MADVKTRNWLFVFYPDSAPAEWREIVADWAFTSPPSMTRISRTMAP